MGLGSECKVGAVAQAYKYVPFGPVEEVMPYLVRRAQENSTVLGGCRRRSLWWLPSCAGASSGSAAPEPWHMTCSQPINLTCGLAGYDKL